MAEKDIFCKIIDKEIPADFIIETDDWVAIYDIRPQTPTHVLVVPKRHIQDIGSATIQDAALLGNLLLGVKKTATKLRLDENGYRVIINNGRHGGQTVPHLHIHILGGRHLGEGMVR